MRLHSFVLPRFSARVPVLAGLLGAILALSGCAQLGSTSITPEPVGAAAGGSQTVQSTKLRKFFWIFSPYRPDIQQGNFVSKEMLAQLEVGQTREQVRFLLGTPLVTDVFHADRWDYPFYLARGNGDLTSAKVTVHFKEDKVIRIDGGKLPSEQEYIAQIAGPPKKPAKELRKKEEVGAASISISK